MSWRPTGWARATGWRSCSTTVPTPSPPGTGRPVGAHWSSPSPPGSPPPRRPTSWATPVPPSSSTTGRRRHRRLPPPGSPAPPWTTPSSPPGGDEPPDDDYLGAPVTTMSYTSGTTGRPKGITRAAPPATREAPPNPYAAFWDLRSGDVHLMCGPGYHMAPAAYSQMSLTEGGTVVIMRQLRRHRGAASHRVRTGDHGPDGPGPFHPHPGGRLGRLRPLEHAQDPARRRPLSGAGQAPHHRRLPGRGRLGVLRRLRGHGLGHLARGVAVQTGQRRSALSRSERPHPRRRRGRAAPRRGGRHLHLGLPRLPLRLPQRPGQDRPRPGARTTSPWAIWAGSTRTAICSWPTGAPTSSSPAG